MDFTVRKRNGSRIVTPIVVILLAILFLVPFYFLVGNSFKGYGEILSNSLLCQLVLRKQTSGQKFCIQKLLTNRAICDFNQRQFGHFLYSFDYITNSLILAYKQVGQQNCFQKPERWLALLQGRSMLDFSRGHRPPMVCFASCTRSVTI